MKFFENGVYLIPGLRGYFHPAYSCLLLLKEQKRKLWKRICAT